MDPFMLACNHGHKDARDHYGWTALTLACILGLKDVVKLLLEYSKLLDINIKESAPISKDMKRFIELHSMKVQK